LKRAVIVAPIAGEVVDLQVHTTGGVVGLGSRSWTSSRRTRPNRRGKIRTQEFKHVQIGADVTSSSPRTSGGSPAGARQAHLCLADTLSERSANGEAQYYQAYVQVKKADLEAAGGLELTPGMPVQLHPNGQSHHAGVPYAADYDSMLPPSVSTDGGVTKNGRFCLQRHSA